MGGLKSEEGLRCGVEGMVWWGGHRGGGDSERPGPRRHLLTGSIQGSKEEPMRGQETVHEDWGTD